MRLSSIIETNQRPSKNSVYFGAAHCELSVVKLDASVNPNKLLAFGTLSNKVDKFGAGITPLPIRIEMNLAPIGTKVSPDKFWHENQEYWVENDGKMKFTKIQLGVFFPLDIKASVDGKKLQSKKATDIITHVLTRPDRERLVLERAYEAKSIGVMRNVDAGYFHFAQNDISNLIDILKNNIIKTPQKDEYGDEDDTRNTTLGFGDIEDLGN